MDQDPHHQHNPHLAEAREFMSLYFKREPRGFQEIRGRHRLARVRQEIAQLERRHFGTSAAANREERSNNPLLMEEG